MTDFSKFLIKKEFGDDFYDFKSQENKIQVFNFTININYLKTSGNMFELDTEIVDKKMLDYLNSFKTFTARISSIMLENTKETSISQELNSVTTPICCVLLEVKISKIRQNFDEFVWREFLKY